MSVFRALGWLLGIAPAEQRQQSKFLKEDERKNYWKIKDKVYEYTEIKEKIFEDLGVYWHINDLINSFPITYNSQGTRLSINSNSYQMFEIIVFKYINDLYEELKFEQTQDSELKNAENIAKKHFEIWKKKKTVEELQEVYDLAVSKEKNSDVDKIEMLEKEKRILELEKEIRELKANNRERDR